MERWKRRMSSGCCCSCCCWRYKYLEIRSRESFKREKKKRTFLWLPLYVRPARSTLLLSSYFLVENFLFHRRHPSRNKKNCSLSACRDFLLSKQHSFFWGGRGFYSINQMNVFKLFAARKNNKTKKTRVCMYVCVWMFMLLLFYTHDDLIACVLLLSFSVVLCIHLMECQARAFKSPARYILSSPLPVWIYLTVQSRRRRFQNKEKRRKKKGLERIKR
jgi:hypothetical protein